MGLGEKIVEGFFLQPVPKSRLLSNALGPPPKIEDDLVTLSISLAMMISEVLRATESASLMAGTLRGDPEIKCAEQRGGLSAPGNLSENDFPTNSILVGIQVHVPPPTQKVGENPCL